MSEKTVRSLVHFRDGTTDIAHVDMDVPVYGAVTIAGRVYGVWNIVKRAGQKGPETDVEFEMWVGEAENTCRAIAHQGAAISPDASGMAASMPSRQL